MNEGYRSKLNKYYFQIGKDGNVSSFDKVEIIAKYLFAGDYGNNKRDNVFIIINTWIFYIDNYYNVSIHVF